MRIGLDGYCWLSAPPAVSVITTSIPIASVEHAMRIRASLALEYPPLVYQWENQSASDRAARPRGRRGTFGGAARVAPGSTLAFARPIRCYAKCGEPKKLVKLPGVGHYDSYEFRNPGMSEIVYQETHAWFRKYL